MVKKGKKIDVLLLSRYFPPDIGTAANLFFDLATALKRNGHEVTVVTGYPWYNLEEIPKDYRRGIFKRETYAGISVVRVRVPMFGSKKLNLALGHILSPLALLVGGVTLAKVDVIYCYSPPLLVAYVGRLLSWKMKATLVLGVQDLHPQAYIDQGVLKNPLLIKIFRFVEKIAYQLSDIVTVHSKGSRNHVVSIMPSRPECVEVVSNWVNITKVVPHPKKNIFSKQLNCEDKFIVGYAGTIGLSQGTECIIEAAIILKEHEEINFLIVGGGIEKQRIEKQAIESGVKNIVFLEMQTEENYPYVVGSFDIGLVTLNDMVKTPVIPSKIISIMAAQRPVIGSIPESDAANLVRTANCGIVVPPASPEKLAESILRMFYDPVSRKIYGKNGRKYVEDYLSSDIAVSQLEKIFEYEGKNFRTK